jgi:hypothetical protein
VVYKRETERRERQRERERERERENERYFVSCLELITLKVYYN